MKVVVTDYIEKDLNWEIEYFRQSGIDFHYYQLKHLPVRDLIEAVKDADVIVVNMCRIDASVIQYLKNCKLIIRHGAGYDNIDVKASTDANIQVSFIPDYCQEEVAEQAMLLMLTAYRKFTSQLMSMDLSLKQGIWDFSPVIPIHRFSYCKVGIVGCGRIGSKVLQMLRGFQIDVLVNDPYLSEERQEELAIKCLPLDTVLCESDIVSLHCSLNDETRYLIDTAQLKKMKKTAILVNTARGGIVNSVALSKACKENWIAGSAIDVFEKEPPPQDYSLIGLSNVILTPHLSWYSVEAEWSIREKIVEDINRFVNGLLPRYPVNKVHRY